MTKVEENLNSMFSAVTSVMESNQSKVDGLPAMANAFTNFKAKVADIQAKDSEYRHMTAGKTDMKNDAEEAMIDAVLPIAAAMNVYAKVNGMNAG